MSFLYNTRLFINIKHLQDQIITTTQSYWNGLSAQSQYTRKLLLRVFGEFWSAKRAQSIRTPHSDHIENCTEPLPPTSAVENRAKADFNATPMFPSLQAAAEFASSLASCSMRSREWIHEWMLTVTQQTAFSSSTRR